MCARLAETQELDPLRIADAASRWPEAVRAEPRRWVERVGRMGLAARGVVFALVGIFLIQASMQQDPGAAIGLGGALQKLAEQPYGEVLLGVVAAGLCMYGLFSLVEARYGRLKR